MATRKWHMHQALTSVRVLDTVLDELTLEEVIAALDLESASQRRRSVTDRLIKRAISITKLNLETKYHG